MGLSTALYLSLEHPDSKTALIEQYEIGHKEGSSHSETRVMRSVYDVEFYRDLCIECKENYWPIMEQIIGEQLVFPNPYLAYIEEETNIYQHYKKTASTSKTIK
jgi:glycine/D-amino acid oxidase-like deaminating enzyme